MEDTYLTLEGPCEGLFKVKGSKHFGYGWPIHDEKEAARHLQSLRKEHHGARHVAYAWMLGHNGTHCKSSDDGEPSNSAGPPILGVIRAHGLTRVLFCVVRYFGGTKLGVGGLIEAYREGAAEALRNGKVIECIRTQRHEISFKYEHMGVVMGLLKRWDIQPATTDFQLSCSLEVDVRLGQVQAFVEAIGETRVATIKAI